MSVEATFPETFLAALHTAGMPEVPGEFSVVPAHQVIPRAVLTEIAAFIRVFDQVTSREAWRAASRREAPRIAQTTRREVCFFSAWDFHLSPEGGCRLIEFNDNGSGFLFAAIINASYYEAAGLSREKWIATPVGFSAFGRYIRDLAEQEAKAFFGEFPKGLFLILDDAESLRQGKFRRELQLLCELFRRQGRRAEIGCPAQTRWDGRQLLFEREAIGFIINRSTDFLWNGEEFSALRTAYESGDVYVAPNPFTYATRSDKRLLEWLSLPQWDKDLGIRSEERRILNAHMPETHVIRADNVKMLAQEKSDFVFKPFHGFAGRGLLDSDAVGRARLRRLVKHDQGYVAQRRVPKSRIDVEGTALWTDLRVWAYRGDVFLISGRASRRPDRLELTPPGGWLPTYASL